ncbi:unnamed protein product [Eruca vesicaria subsp. sativa]|uniref:Uncharacterized protein n=1 Tax=Eruca vesicaria subsp. sativa TaxID=29727 RepID=A0ABC8L733_ERUVS|nr:unnamed protein product [Eruca vesicaria subsp. sativa]
MDSLSSKRNYPRLLYKKRKAPSQRKSMSYYSYLSNFQMVEVGVGLDGWDAVKKSAIGVFPRFYELMVRVKPFITQTEGELLPQWDDGVDDEDVTSLVDDIRNDCVDQGFWDVTEEPPD